MKRNLFKKLAAAAGAAVMALTLVMPMGVSAATSEYPAVGEKGSLTITKYVGEDTSWDETDPAQNPPQDGQTLDGVTFTIKKVGTVSQEKYTEKGQEKIGLVYTITDNKVKTDILDGKDSVDTGKYTSTVLDQALKDAYRENHNVADSIVADGISKITANGGKAEFTELEQGLYLVAETQAPSTVTGKSVPFFVSIPSIVNAVTGNNQWEMNVNAYPKNSTSETKIDKKIIEVTNDTADPSQIATSGESAQATIGDTITYKVPVTAIIPDGGLKKLGITDTMSKGLTFVMASDAPSAADVAVYRGDNVDAGNKVPESDYTVTTGNGANGATVLNVYFTEQFIKTLNQNATTNDSPHFLFVYKAKLNANAVIGTEGNENAVKLVYNYNNNPNQDTDIETNDKKTKVYTWGIDITKNGESNDALSGVVFNLYKDSEEGQAMKFAPNGNVYTVSENGNADLTTDSSGKIYIKGLESGTYYLKETKTLQGYVLLKDSIKIEIIGNNENGTASAEVNDSSVTMNSDGTSESALVPITVVNNKGFDLPQTGAAGTAIFAIAGIVLVAVAGALLIFRRKTQK